MASPKNKAGTTSATSGGSDADGKIFVGKSGIALEGEGRDTTILSKLGQVRGEHRPAGDEFGHGAAHKTPCSSGNLWIATIQ